MKIVRTILTAAAMSMMFAGAFAQSQQAIDAELKKGNAVFLVVTDNARDLAATKDIAVKAKALCARSAVVTLDRLDKANAAVIRKYGLTSTKEPMILVIASNGVATNGYTRKEATPQLLAEEIPTPRQSDALLAFEQKKAAIVVMYRKGMADKAAAVEASKKACAEMKGGAITVEVDLDDKTEQPFIKLLKPSKTAKGTQVHVFNKAGDIIETYTAPFSAAKIAAAARQAEAPCCPGGNSKDCKK
ncbi:MAG: hypothetical protein IAE95_04840 [Chitinophagaceae bacterium]|nr:hypothetical protein [Chitinophagaceae bacterium]